MPGKMMTMLSGADYQQGPLTVVAGLAAIKFLSPRGRDRSEVTVARDIVLPARESEIIDYIFDTPTGIHTTNRVLLRRQIIEKKGLPQTYLDTTFAKPADLPASTFELPREYKRIGPQR